MDVLGFLTIWYSTWMALSFTQHLANALGGLIGASMYAAWSNPVIKLPRWDREAGELHLNFVGILIVGMTVAVVIDTGFVVAIIAGMLATPTFTVIVKRFLPGLADAINVVIMARGGGGGYGGYGGYGGGQYGGSGGYGQQDYEQQGYNTPPAEGQVTPPGDPGNGKGD